MSTPTTALTTAPSATSTARRVALLALGLLVVLTGIGLGSAPASALAPTKPQEILAAPYDDFVRVYWAPPLHSDEPVTSYRVERYVDGQLAPPKIWDQATTAPLVDTAVEDGVTYVYRVRATSADGNSPWSESMKATLQPGLDETDPAGGIDSFVTRQYQDFLGRNPGFGEKQTAALNLTNGTWTAGDLIGNLVHRAERAHRHQIIRLYNAYFDRNADHAGLAYWSDQIVAKGKSINTVSSSFAASPEFKTMYGDLTNAQFVTLVYQNVLDRNPKADEVAYWKGQLDQKIINRGRMMTLFSESPEYKALSRGRVLAADVYDAMLDEASSGSELSHWSAHIQAGGNAGDYGTRVMLLNKY
jgi:hypothetical protein